jgi:2-methylcitrate dehydratase PrpD
VETVKKIAEFVVKTNFSALPSSAVSVAKRAIFDTLGVALAGSVEPPCKIITGFVKKMGCKPTCGVIAGKMRTSAPNAALANGIMAHVLDYDDTGAGTQGHPSVPIFPAVMALGEELGSSGKEIITAYILGVEVYAKIAAEMPLLQMKGWHPTAIFGTLGAGTAAAKLLNLDIEQTMMVLGLAGSQAAGIAQNFGTFTKSFHAGNAARSGIIAALLVKDGFTATKDILEGNMGFPVTFFGGEAVDVARMSENLGQPFAAVSPGINVKKYPACYLTHRAIDATIHLAVENKLKPEEVAEVDVQFAPWNMKILLHDKPTTSMEAAFSMHFLIAASLIYRKVGLSEVTDVKVQDPLILDLQRKVKMRPFPDADANENGDNRPEVITIKMKTGKEYSHSVLRARGHSDVPISWDELSEKYRDCAGITLAKKEVEKSIELMYTLESLSDIKELSRIVTD